MSRSHNSHSLRPWPATVGAETWKPGAMLAGLNASNGLTIDPSSPNRLYLDLAAWSRVVGTHGEAGGIYWSKNGGESWEQVLDRDRHIYDVTIDPGDSNRLHATGFESNRKKIYVTTFGGGVWHGSVDGNRQPVDIATPELELGQGKDRSLGCGRRTIAGIFPMSEGRAAPGFTVGR